MNRQMLSRLLPALLLIPPILLLLWQPELNRTLFLALHHGARELPTGFWRFCSIFGDWPTALALMLVVCLHHPQRLPTFLLGSVITILLTIGLKAGFAVPRPPLVLPPGEVMLLDALPSNDSFPSGHATAVATLTTFLFCYGSGWGRAFLLMLLAGLVILSRIAIGVHWPLDVLAGALLGWAVMMLTLRRAGAWRWTPAMQRRVLAGLLFVLAGYLVWLFRQPHAHAEYWLRVAIAVAVLGWGTLRLRR